MNFRRLNIRVAVSACQCFRATGQLEARAQQDPQFSMNMSPRDYYVNPAFAGMNDGICVNLLESPAVGWLRRPT